jgi:hypothetical protein
MGIMEKRVKYERDSARNGHIIADDFMVENQHPLLEFDLNRVWFLW